MTIDHGPGNMSRCFPGIIALAVLSLLSTALPAAAAEGPPCCPCIGATVDDPLAAAHALAAGRILDEDSAVYVRWLVSPNATGAAEGAAALVAAGARPWMMLRFETPAPASENVAALAGEIELIVAMVRQAPPDGHYQVIWEPTGGSVTPEEYAFLLKQVSVALAGADSGARVITAPQPASPEALRELYNWDIVSYVQGLALEPASPDSLEACLVELVDLDPGLPVVVDQLPAPSRPELAVARAAEQTAAGAALTFFDWSAGDADLRPLAVMAREFSGELSHDPYSEPQGGKNAWGFVRAEDLGLRLVVETAAGDGPAVIELGEGGLFQPQLVDLLTGEVAEIQRFRNMGNGYRLTIEDPGPVLLIRVSRLGAAAMDGLEEEITITGEHQMPVAEILRRLQVFEDGQARRLHRYTALQTEYLRFTIPSGGAFEVTREGDFFYTEGQGFDWAWQRVFLGGVKWRGKIPEIPIIQPERAAEMPLEITLLKEYRYRLRGTDTVDGRDCWEVEFEPSGATTSEALWKGTVWIDREIYTRVRTRGIQMGLSGDVFSNVETIHHSPVDQNGQPVEWGADGSFVMPLRRVGQELQKFVSTTVQVEKETLLTALRLNDPEYEQRLAGVLQSDSTMVRDTEVGLRYLKKDDSGSRQVQEKFDYGLLSLVGGIFYDDSLDYPVPLAGIDYYNRNVKDTGIQTNIFFAGLLLSASAADPQLGNSKWNAGADLSGVFIPLEQVLYRDGEEAPEEAVDNQVAQLSLTVGRPLGSYTKVDFSYLLNMDRYNDNKDTAPDFVIPNDTLTHGASLDLTHNQFGYQFGGQATLFSRTDWKPWGFPDSTEYDPGHDQYLRWGVTAQKSWRLRRFTELELELEHVDGQDLDRFSKYDFSTFSGTRVAGYKGGLVTASRADLAHLYYGLSLGEVIRLGGRVDVAWATDQETGLDREFLSGVEINGNVIGPWQLVIRFAVGVPLAGPGEGVAASVFFLKLFK
jgi:hypothetical protein